MNTPNFHHSVYINGAPAGKKFRCKKPTTLQKNFNAWVYGRFSGTCNIEPSQDGAWMIDEHVKVELRKVMTSNPGPDFTTVIGAKKYIQALWKRGTIQGQILAHHDLFSEGISGIILGSKFTNNSLHEDKAIAFIGPSGAALVFFDCPDESIQNFLIEMRKTSYSLIAKFKNMTIIDGVSKESLGFFLSE